MGVGSYHCSKFIDRTSFRILVGLALLNLTPGIPMYYGNLSTYTDSYFIERVGLENHPAGSMWFICIYASLAMIGIILCGYVEKRTGVRATLAVSCTCFNLATFGTFSAVQVSFWAMNIVLGVLGGLAFGFIEGLTVLYAALWFPDNVGMAIAVASSAFGGGGLILNPIITFFINPRNEEPDLDGRTSVYFSNPTILSMVPYVFFVLGGISSITQFVAVILLKPPTDRSGLQNADSSLLHSSNHEQGTCLSMASENTVTLACGPDCERVTTAKDKQEAQEMAPKTINTEVELTPMEMMKTGSFYKLVFVLTMLVLGLHVEINVYKQFGLLTIPDDHFLTLVGTLVNVTICIFRMVWGVVVDTIGPRMSIILCTSLHAIFCVFWFFTPLASKWLYLFCTVAIQAIQSALCVAFPVIILRYFGNAHYVSNYGFAMSSAFLINLIAPPVVDVILVNFGYFWLFFTLAAGSAVAFGVSLYLPSENDRNRA